MPLKHLDRQAAMYTHLSQPIGAGAFDGQHGMSLAISSVVADGDISSAIACVETSGDVSAMTGWETGAKARPAITRIASSRRMVKLRLTNPDSHKIAANERLQPLHSVEIPVTVTEIARWGCTSPQWGMSIITPQGSASSFDHLGDFLRRCENNGGAITHHARRHDCRRTFLGSILAGVGLEAQIALPKGSRLAVGGRDAIGIVTVGDGFDLNSWFEFFKIWVRASSHHSSHATHHAAHALHATLLRRLLRRSGLGGVLEERQQVGANSGVLDAIEGHFIVRHHAVRVGQPSIQRSIVPDNSRRFERLGVAFEARQRASLPSPKI